MASEGRKKQGQTVAYKRSMSEQLHMAVVKVNTRVGKSSRPHYMSFPLHTGSGQPPHLLVGFKMHLERVKRKGVKNLAGRLHQGRLKN